MELHIDELFEKLNKFRNKIIVSVSVDTDYYQYTIENQFDGSEFIGSETSWDGDENESIEDILYYCSGAGVVIREELPETFEGLNGHIFNKSNLYHIFVYGETFKSYDYSVAFRAQNTDSKTGEKLIPEIGVNYCML